MIANKKAATQDKSKARHVSDILDYILKEGQHITEKDSIAQAEVLNCSANLNSYESLKQELIETANMSVRSKNTMCHIVLSFKTGEHPTKEQVEDAVKTVLKETGYDQCKTVYAFHDNTDNRHIHIAVNRVNPETGKLCSDSNDIYKIHKALARIEHKQGWQREKNGLYVVIDEELHAAIQLNDKQHKLSEGARMSELHTGVKSVERVATEEIKEILLSSASWRELHERLALKSFEYIQKGGGAVIRGHFEDGQKEVKASTISNKTSLKKLEQKLGRFQPSKNNEIIARKPELLINTDDPTVKKAIEAYTSQRIEKNSNISKLYKEHEEAKQNLTEERKKIYEIMYNDNDLKGKGLALDALKSVLSKYHNEQLQNLSESYREKLNNGRQALKSVSDFEVWLSLNCPSKTEQIKGLLTKAVNETVFIEEPKNEQHQEKVRDFIEYHSAVNADRYRITARGEKDGKPIAFVFDKTEGVSRGYTPQEVVEKIGKMTRYEQKMEHIYLTPLSESKIHLLVDDMTPETLEKMKADGFVPSCVIQSSSHSLQSIFTIPKPNTGNLRESVNAISRGLNSRYGDINLSGAEHPHRAPGFMNPKLKYRDVNGGYPKARIVETHKDAPCEKILSFIAYQSEIYTERQQANQTKPQTAQSVENIRSGGDLEKSLYNAHRASILKITGLSSSANESRLDAMIAERLRATGHDQGDIQRILAAGIDPAREKRLESYIPLTAAHAFGADASHRIEMLRPFYSQWKGIEQKEIDRIQEQKRLKEQQEMEQERQEQRRSRSRDHGISR
jgi:hypothetical protein